MNFSYRLFRSSKETLLEQGGVAGFSIVAGDNGKWEKIQKKNMLSKTEIMMKACLFYTTVMIINKAIHFIRSPCNSKPRICAEKANILNIELNGVSLKKVENIK